MNIINDETENDLHIVVDSWAHDRTDADPERLAAHIAAHVKEAREANEGISDMWLRSAADAASKASDGRVHFLYIAEPGTTRYYLFAPDNTPRTHRDALSHLQGIVQQRELAAVNSARN